MKAHSFAFACGLAMAVYSWAPGQRMHRHLQVSPRPEFRPARVLGVSPPWPASTETTVTRPRAPLGVLQSASCDGAAGADQLCAIVSGPSAILRVQVRRRCLSPDGLLLPALK